MARFKSIRRLSVTIAALLLGGFGTARAEVWSTPTEITELYPTATGYFFLTTYANTALSTCDDGRRWHIPRSYENYDAMVASLLLAFASNKQIKMALDEVPASCGGQVNRFFVLQ